MLESLSSNATVAKIRCIEGKMLTESRLHIKHSVVWKIYFSMSM